MLVAEYDYDTDIAVQREESLRIGIQQGIERGKSLGLIEGEVRGFRQAKRETAIALKRLGIDIAKIAEGTGLSREEVEKL